MTKLILTDIDGTILNYLGAITEWMRGRGMTSNGEPDHAYSLHTYLNVSLDALEGILQEFAEHDDFASLSPLPHAQESVQRLHQEGFRFIAVTASPATSKARSSRIRNLEEAFGIEWDDVILTDYDKRPVLRSFDPAIWVEDHPRNAAHGAEIGHRTFLIDQKYNREECPGTVRVADWREIEAALLR